MTRGLAVLSRHLRNLRGGAQSILAEATDGKTYVVKFRNNLQGPNVCFNDAMGSELYRACGLPVPAWKPVFLNELFVIHNPDCWLHDQETRQPPETGLCFGSQFLGGDDIELTEIYKGRLSFIKNRKDFWLAWLVDTSAFHKDRRQAILRKRPGCRLEVIFIDHGHLFGGPKGDLRRYSSKCCRYYDPHVYTPLSHVDRSEILVRLRSFNADKLWRQVRQIPEEWVTESAFANFSVCLNRLSDAKMLENNLDEINEIHIGSSNERERFELPEKALWEILFPGVPTEGKRTYPAVARARHLAGNPI